jgi:hypothetical protein
MARMKLSRMRRGSTAGHARHDVDEPVGLRRGEANQPFARLGEATAAHRGDDLAALEADQRTARPPGHLRHFESPKTES